MKMNNTSSVYNELISIADRELKKIEQELPQESLQGFALFIEAMRFLDYLHFGEPDTTNEYIPSYQEFDIMLMGWNIAASLLIKPINSQGVPAMRSTRDTRHYAASLLYKLGCTSLLRRTAEMVKSGIMNVELSENGFTFKQTETAKSQFLDQIEYSDMNKLERKLKTNKDNIFLGWNIYKDLEELNQLFWEKNNLFMGNHKYLSDFKKENIDSLMFPLIKPWNSGHGIMMGYDTTAEVDFHFLAIATEYMREWRDEAGFDPEMKIGGVSGSDILTIVLIVMSFHLKHVHFASIAANRFPEISVPQSLTIWKPWDELKRSLADFSHIDENVVSKVLDLILLKQSDVSFLRTHTSKFMPLMIDMENGYVLCPVSSIIRNPLLTISAILESRGINIRHNISTRREEWLRSYLYAMFSGNRYKNVDGHVKLRENRRIVTDIDAAIFDNVSGQLALFQIKWQDYFLNDVKKLRSKAKNLTREFDEWATKVNKWIKSNGIAKLARNLRLNNVCPTKIFLFGLSKNAARMQGYGFTLNNQSIAIGTWSQFLRNRIETGPESNVFEELFQVLKKQEKDTVSPKPMPISITIEGNVFYFEDLYNAFDD